jgi:predicted metal-dependent HD superfamily phosphohydrolase
MSLISQDLLASLQARYAEPHRAYHNWYHIDAMLKWSACGEFSLFDGDAVHCAILFHDAIYDPVRKDNEELSAQLAEDSLAGVLPPERLGLVATMIRATTAHQMPGSLDPESNHDTAHFLDMDLSILGADWQVFETYEENIRLEYSCYPDALFWPGRATVLENFLKRERLYFSEWGFARFEQKARKNLKQALDLARQRGL